MSEEFKIWREHFWPRVKEARRIAEEIDFNEIPGTKYYELKIVQGQDWNARFNCVTCGSYLICNIYNPKMKNVCLNCESQCIKQSSNYLLVEKSRE